MPHTTRTFDKICTALGGSPRFIDNRGGARSGKTIAEMQVAAILAQADRTPTVTTVGSDTLPHLKVGAIRDFKFAMEDLGLWDESRWSKSSSLYTFQSGSVIEFYGINDAPGKALGPARDRLILNEANLLQWDVVRQMLARTSGLVMYDYNPAAPFWGTEEIPKRDRYALVHSTYLDNQYIPDEVRREIEANRDSGNWWRVYGLGLIGQVEGQVFDFVPVDAMPDPAGYKESWGMDFGFAHDPTTVIRCLIHTGRREIYADEMLWQTGMTNPEIAAALKGMGIGRRGSGPTVQADAAEPKSIAEVASRGLDVVACDKRTPVREQLQILRAWKIYVTRRSVNLLDEGRKYLYKQRPDGTFTHEPIDFFNHCFVAGTQVQTPNGERAIETLRPGDFVETSAGPRKVTTFFENGCKEIFDFSLKFSTFEVNIRATKDHPVKTSKGWKKISELQAGETLYLFRTSTESATTSMRVSDTIHAGRTDCTASSGNTFTARSRKDMRSTTSTATRQTTIRRILNVFRQAFTPKSTMIRQANARGAISSSSSSTESGKRQRSGMEARRDACGTKPMPSSAGKTFRSGRRPANAAELLSNIVALIFPDFAQTTASRNGAGTQASTMSPVSVQSAEGLSLATDMQRQGPAAEAVLISIEMRPAGTADVFDICVEDMHEFFAAGLLVHNCTDALRYAAGPYAINAGYGIYHVR